jgi:hypothetical protein
MWKTITLVTSLTLWAAAVPGNAYAASQIRDGADLFSSAAEAQAIQILNEIQTKTGLWSLVETVTTLPADVRQQFDANPDQRGAVARRWAEGRAQQERVSGIYIGIAKSPGTFEIEPSATAGRILPKSDVDRIVTTMRDAFKARDFDRGLTAGLTQMRDSMLQNAGNLSNPVERAQGNNRTNTGVAVPAPAGTSRSGGWGLGACVIPLLILVVAIFFLRRVMGGRQSQGYGYGSPPPPPLPGQGYDPRYGAPGPGGGGGFGRGILGGLLGGMAGSWLYDKVSGGGSAHGSNMGNDPSQFPASGGGPSLRSDGSDAGMGEGGGGFFGEPSGGGGDSGGGGADFGGGGGGDFGGGDGGGGDF